jgi:sigma-54 dependent transcriptional regulator, acetoin dehydrogenase operon transcriptional activator AcoR
MFADQSMETGSIHQEAIENRINLLKKAWKDFVATGRLRADDAVSAEVLSSWTRSRNRGIDTKQIPTEKLSPTELQERLEKNCKLLEVAIPFLQEIAENVGDTNFRVDLFDADCYLLWTQGEGKVMQDSKKLSLIEPGIARSEAACGTNAINLAALLEKPVQLLGPEHYNEALQYWTCSAVPIKDEAAKVIAVINAAGSYWLIHKHTLGMMTALAKSIEYCLCQKSIQKKLEETNKFYTDVMDSSTDALVVVNSDEKILMTNLVAKKIFGLKNMDLDGIPIGLLFGANNPFSKVLFDGCPILDKEISFSCQNRVIRLMGSIRTISLVGGLNKGAVGTFKAQKHTRGILKNFVGWKAQFSFENLIGDSKSFRQVIRLARETAKIGSNVLIQGESGTGKELFAQAIHNSSTQYEGPFVAVNCAAIPSGLIESEFFGYEGGAFSGAKKEGKPGRFELAEGGSIFLDEINSLPLDMQAKILRILQNRTVVRLGGKDEIPVHVRVISASNADLWQLVQNGGFREDLFYRINVITINLPPLRERGNDLELLIEYILKQKKLSGEIFEPDALQILKCYDWPGNIRELENVLERSYVFALARGADRVQAEDVMNYPGIERSLRSGQEVGYETEAKAAFPVPGMNLKENEKQMILHALQASSGNVSAAAQLLDIPRNTLYRKMKRFSIIR